MHISFATLYSINSVVLLWLMQKLNEVLVTNETAKTVNFKMKLITNRLFSKLLILNDHIIGNFHRPSNLYRQFLLPFSRQMIQCRYQWNNRLTCTVCRILNVWEVHRSRLLKLGLDVRVRDVQPGCGRVTGDKSSNGNITASSQVICVVNPHLFSHQHAYQIHISSDKVCKVSTGVHK